VADITQILNIVMPLVVDAVDFIKKYEAEKGKMPTLAEVTAQLNSDVDASVASIDAWVAAHPSE
jgi:hypothetical protein